MNYLALLGSVAAILPAIIGSSLAQEKTLTGAPTIVVAHRGASGYLPEHTLEAYKMAIDMGADYIEPDLVVTKDGVLIARHEPMLSGTTDVANRPEFASRKTTRKVDGVDTTDWFASDFTLAEIKQLRAKQAMSDRDQSKNGQFQVPTLQEVIDLAKKEGAARGKAVGIAPETKHSTFHAALGLPMEDRLVNVLKEAGWADASAPVVIQSFEVANLKYLNSRIDVKLAQLLDAEDVDKDGNIVLNAPYAQPYDFVVVGDKRTYKDLLTKEGLAEVKSYADILAPWKPYILPTKQVDQNNDGKADDLNGDGKADEQDRVLAEPTSVVKDAHAAGLQVFTWTFRNEPKRLASTFKGDPAAEYKAFYALGVDGLFSDFPDTAVKAR
ncbi:glycerophosphodiester phosphodiesterase [Microvirga splendida]|uniref:glycerophosphodiester phosphodiesterase n=1 Tax=Microvirga splendida TaxID=2795727 RepID=A0ABS0XY97_9HYPH|nr:glycerophosphodiester phosphodiesterase [Microvirga splendida]MBJ6125039.1 glycerophosphodiester phosphodiesterase [Microvirga splendida]